MKNDDWIMHFVFVSDSIDDAAADIVVRVESDKFKSNEIGI